LIEIFGKRRCESMLDLMNEHEEDPRKAQTWPCSPDGFKDESAFEPMESKEVEKITTRGVTPEEFNAAVGRK
jgi:hypothetical protein